MGGKSRPSAVRAGEILWTSWNAEGPRDENGHLIPGHGSFRAEVATAASGGDAFSGQLLNPGGRPVIRGDIGEDTRRNGRYVARAMLGFEQEDRHLVATHRSSRAEIATATTSGNAFRGQLLDPGVCPVADRDIVEASAGADGGRYIGGAVFALQQEDRHLVAGDSYTRTIHQRVRGATSRDPGIV